MSDPLSVIAGVLGSYTACCEIFKQIQSIRKFHKDSEIQVDLLELQAYRVVSWGEGHNLRQKTLDVRETLTKEQKHLNKILALFQDVRLLFDKYGVRYEKPLFPANEDETSVTESTSLRSSTKALLRRSTMPIRRLQWSVSAKDELRLQCNDIKNHVDSIYEVWPLPRPAAYLVSADTNVAKMLQESLENILGSQKPQQLAQLEVWLSLDSLRLNPHQDLETYTKRLAPNSCQWIEENNSYKGWRSSHDQKYAASILWIEGTPGRGKSILCASLVQKFKTEGSLLAFFFSTKHAQTGGDVNFILRFWVQQLAEKNAEIRQLMIELCSRDDASTRTTNDNVWELFRMILKMQSDLIFVIDGVDEYYRHDKSDDEYHERRELFMSELIESCINYGCNTRLLIVSRPMRSLNSLLSHNSITESGCVFRHSIRAEDVAQDTQLLATNFIRGTFSKFTVKDQDKLIDEMVELSKGSFLWIDSVKKRMKPNLRIGLLSKEMRSVPSDLREKYNKDLAVLAKIDPHKTLTILSWILLAKRPVTVWEMCQVLAVQVDDLQLFVEYDLFPDPLDDEWIEDNISQFCGDMVVILDEQVKHPDSWLGATTLSPLHPSVSDHLLPLLMSEKTMNYCQQLFRNIETKSSAHLHVAKICFAWLINNDLDTELTVERPSPSASRLKDYALQFWHVHLEEAPDRDSFPLDLLLDFFQKENDRFVDWATHFEGGFVANSGWHTAIASPLYYAASLGLKDAADAIIRDDPSQINHVDGFYGSALMAALSHKRLACFQHLLQKGADPDLLTKAGCVFLMAVQLRAVTFLELLLKFHAYPKIKDKEKANALHILASYRYENTSDDRTIFRILLEQGLDLNSRNAQGDTPLIIASASGHIELVKMILSHEDVHLNAINNDNQSAIYKAIKQNRLAVSEILLKAGAEFIVRLSDGYTPFCLACENGNIRIVKMLIANISAIGHIDMTTQSDKTPIFLAACKGHADVVELLLDNGAEYMRRCGVGFTPLHVACANGYLDVVRLLLKSDTAVVNDRVSNDIADRTEPLDSYCKLDDGGSTPLILAAKRGHENVVKVLLELKIIDMLITDADGQTAIHHAAANGFTTILKDLLNRMLLEDLPRHNKNNPLYYSIQNGHLDTVKILLEHNFDANVSESNKTNAINQLILIGPYDILTLLVARWENTFNALWDCLSSNRLFDYAFQSYDDDILKLLLRTYTAKDPDNKPDLTDWTPLGYAAICGEQQIAIDLLLQLETHPSVTNIDHFNGGKHTALHLAAVNGHIDLVEALLVHGADLTLVDKYNGETSLHKAIKSGRIKLVEMLLTHLQSLDRLDILNLADHYNLTPIFEAISGNYPDIFVLLLEWGADATGKTTDVTPLYQAVVYGHREIVINLLTHLRDTNKLENIEQESTIGGGRETALFKAITKADLVIARDLIEYGANVSRTWQGTRYSPMINIAVRHGHWQIVELMCTKDSSVLSQTDADGWTPLIMAAYRGDTRMVRLLLDQPNDTTLITDPTGRNALHYATIRGHTRIVKLLLQHSPSLLNMSDLYGATAFSLAARWQQREVVELLMKMPDIDYDIQDIYGRDVISWLIITAGIEDDKQVDKDEALALAVSKMAQTIVDDEGIFCDVCTLHIDTNNQVWHCGVCHGANFDICQRCRDAGAHCHDREHELMMWSKTADEHEITPPGHKEKADLIANFKTLYSSKHREPDKTPMDKINGSSKEATDGNGIENIPSNLNEDFDFDAKGLPHPKVRQRRWAEVWRRSGRKAFEQRKRQTGFSK